MKTQEEMIYSHNKRQSIENNPEMTLLELAKLCHAQRHKRKYAFNK